MNEPENATEGDERAKSSPSRMSWASRFIKQVKWRSHWLLPNTLRSPYGEEKAYFEQRDRESNEKSRVPEDEELRLCVVWGIELFGPAEVEGLYDQLHRLNWSAGLRSQQEGGALNWVRHQRAYGGAGGWYNVGLVSERSDRKRFLMVDNYASMPEGVDHLYVRIFQLTPSLTSVLIGFVFKESVELTYERELNQVRRTVRERSKHRWSISIIDPSHLKQRSIEKARSKIRAIARKWFAANLPGFFCGLPIDRMPTAELVTTKVHHLLPEMSDLQTSVNSAWRHLLSNASRFDVWINSDCASLRFETNNNGWTKETSHLVVAMCTSQVPEATFKHWGGHERRAYVAYCHEQMDGILSNYAALAFLKEASKDLKLSRTALAIGNAGRRKTVRALEQIQSFFDRSLGMPAVVAELLDRSKHVGHYKHECGRFFSPGWGNNDAQREFGVVLCEQTQFLATRVISEEHSMREHFEQLSTVLSVRESVRAQKRMEWLTVIALGVWAPEGFK